MRDEKPREWVLPLKTLIINDGKGLSAWVKQEREDETHVIEYSAYNAITCDLIASYKTLEFVTKTLSSERDEARSDAKTGALAQLKTINELRAEIERLNVELGPTPTGKQKRWQLWHEKWLEEYGKNKELRTLVSEMVSVLKYLLADTQHADHNCGDKDCPVDIARDTLERAKKVLSP